MPSTPDLRPLLEAWRADTAGTYRTWFLWEERLRNFRAIRRGIMQVIDEIAAGTFGCAYRGSSLETVVGSIAEQRQIFKGADHAFLWKPKLRIPDIYESRDNQVAFGEFLRTCMCCNAEAALLTAVHDLDRKAIKGLGPAVANILYFLHPTLVPPSNTAIVEGYNRLTGARVKLGRWSEYLAMRAGILRLNDEYRTYVSNDLGAIAGLLFDLGSGRYTPPPTNGEQEAQALWARDVAEVRAQAATVSKAVAAAEADERSHTEIQAWLRDLGLALGYRVWVAANDRGRPIFDGRLGDHCLAELPLRLQAGNGSEAVRLIDVLWLDQASERVVAAFEVEHTTSIYSGVVRLLDLALGNSAETAGHLFLVAPDAREKDVREQLRRPAFSRIGDLRVRYICYSDLQKNREAIARFGSGLKPIEALAKDLV